MGYHQTLDFSVVSKMIQENGKDDSFLCDLRGLDNDAILFLRDLLISENMAGMKRWDEKTDEEIFTLLDKSAPVLDAVRTQAQDKSILAGCEQLKSCFKLGKLKRRRLL